MVTVSFLRFAFMNMYFTVIRIFVHFAFASGKKKTSGYNANYFQNIFKSIKAIYF